MQQHHLRVTCAVGRRGHGELEMCRHEVHGAAQLLLLLARLHLLLQRALIVGCLKRHHGPLLGLLLLLRNSLLVVLGVVTHADNGTGRQLLLRLLLLLLHIMLRVLLLAHDM